MKTLPAYVPMDRRQVLTCGEGLPDRTEGAALFADVSGFTPLTRVLTRELGNRAGAEELLRQINPVYQALITELYRYRGSVIGFAGDSITCWLDEAHGPAAPRAVACALAMQRAMRQFERICTPAGTSIAIGIKAALSAGPVRRFLVGDPDIYLVETLAGRTLERMAAAESLASTGEVIADRAVADTLGQALIVAEWRGDDAGFAVVERLMEEVAPTPWQEIPPEMLASAHVQPWILPSVYACLQAGESFLGDLRPVTPLFLRFGGLDYDQDDQAGAKLDEYIRWVQSVVDRYGGNLLQLTIGDKGAYLYAVFGAPVAHEDDTGRALAAALELARPPSEWTWLEQIQIGISRGEAWTGACGSPSRHTYSVLGDEVNLAARLMVSARPGQTLVSDSVVEHPDFFFALVGEVACKGFAQMVPTYQLLGRLEREGRFFPHPLVGRDAELQRLLDWAQPLFAGHLAGAAVIYGEPGMGKSHLSFALQQVLGNRVTWFAGQTDQVLCTALNPFSYWLRHYFGQSPASSAKENRVRFERKLGLLLAALEEHLADGVVSPSERESLTALGAELARTQSVLGALVGLHWPDSLYERLDARGRRENALYALKALLLVESFLRPVVFELEDAHWLDEASQEFLNVLTRDIGDYPLLLLITSRYADDGSRPTVDLAPGIPKIELDLPALSSVALRVQAEEVLAGPVDEGLYAFLQEMTQANPFFAQQILYYFQENNLLVRSPQGDWTARATTFDLPAGIQAILVARIDRLAQEVKTVVQTAAVLGREFEVRVLSSMLQTDVLPVVQQAEQEQIWVALRELRYLFKHALLRDAAYEMQLWARRRELHRIAAAAYETLYAADLSAHYATLAYHYGQVGDQVREREYTWLAAQQAAAQFANPEAARFLSRTLELTPADRTTERYEVLLAREKVLGLQGQREAQAQDLIALEALAEVLDDDRRRAVVALRRAHYADALGDFAAASAAVETAIDLAPACGATDLAAEGLLWSGRILWRQGHYEAARAQLERCLLLSREAQLPALEAECLRNHGIVCWYLGDYAGAESYAGQALALHRAQGDLAGEAGCLGNLALVAVGRGDFACAWDYFSQALRVARDVGDRYSESLQVGNLGALAIDVGDYEAARAYNEHALRLCRAIGNRQTEVVNLGVQSTICQRLGEYAESLSLAQQVVHIGEEIGDRMAQGYGWNYVAHALLALGRLAEATTAYEQSLAIRRALGQHNLAMDCLSGLVRVALAQGNPALAQGHLEEILGFLESNELEGTEEPMQVYLSCYQALLALGDTRAPELLAVAHALLQDRAERISDLEMRQSFLEKVAAHREIVAAWRAATAVPTDLRPDQGL